MSFNRNQYFYASIWWVSALPGGRAFATDICRDHGKVAPDFRLPPAQKGHADAQQARSFFNVLQQDLLKGHIPAQIVKDGAGHFMKVDEAARRALAAVGLAEGLLPQGLEMYLHDDGQILVPMTIGQKKKIIAHPYPGQDVLSYRLVNLAAENFVQRPLVIKHEFNQQCSGPVPCIEAARAMQLGKGGDFSLVSAGDCLLWEDNALQIVRKDEIDQGRVSLVRIGNSPAPR